MFNPPFLGSGGRGGAATGVGVDVWGVEEPYGSDKDPEDGLDCN